MSTIFSACPELSTEVQKTINTRDLKFKCEICQIKVRSAQKLEDHVNFSPLHQNMLDQLNISDRDVCSRNSSSTRPRLIYDGAKLFWRVNETLDISIYEDTGCRTISIYASNPETDLHLQPIALHSTILEKIIDEIEDIDEKKVNESDDAIYQSNQRDAKTKFILQRLHVHKDRKSKLSLEIQKLNGDEFEVSKLVKENGSIGQTPERPRRHTFEDMMEVQKEFNKETKLLKNAVENADKMSVLTRLSLDTFSELAASVREKHQQNSSLSPSSVWIGAYNKVRHQAEVHQTREKIEKNFKNKKVYKKATFK